MWKVFMMRCDSTGQARSVHEQRVILPSICLFPHAMHAEVAITPYLIDVENSTQPDSRIADTLHAMSERRSKARKFHRCCKPQYCLTRFTSDQCRFNRRGAASQKTYFVSSNGWNV